MHLLLVMIFAASAPPAAAAPCSAATTALLPPPARRRWLLFGVALNLLFSVGCGPALLTSYANTALAGQPELSAVVPSVGFSREGGELFSAEWLATLVAPATAAYSFQCEVANGAAILWLDDHLLCGGSLLLPHSIMNGAVATRARARAHRTAVSCHFLTP
jgi:hypothetical protein